eukprot:COSAG02_NODE_48199_length_335_cov_1.063559_1_plen_88_part_01
MRLIRPGGQTHSTSVTTMTLTVLNSMDNKKTFVYPVERLVLRERCELVARRNASHPSPRPSAQKVRRGTCPRTLEEGAGEHHLAPLAP